MAPCVIGNEVVAFTSSCPITGPAFTPLAVTALALLIVIPLILLHGLRSNLEPGEKDSELTSISRTWREAGARFTGMTFIISNIIFYQSACIASVELQLIFSFANLLVALVLTFNPADPPPPGAPRKARPDFITNEKVPLRTGKLLHTTFAFLLFTGLVSVTAVVGAYFVYIDGVSGTDVVIYTLCLATACICYLALLAIAAVEGWKYCAGKGDDEEGCVKWGNFTNFLEYLLAIVTLVSVCFVPAACVVP